MKHLSQRKLPQLFAVSSALCTLLALPTSVFAGGPYLGLVEDFGYTTSDQAILLDVMSNDNIALNDPRSFTTITEIGTPKILGVSEPSYYKDNGTATIETNNNTFGIPVSKITYLPTASFTGVVEISYTVQDNTTGTEAIGIVRVAVSPATVASAHPEAGDDTAVTIPGKTIYINPFWNDTGSNLTIKEVNGIYGNNGSMTIDEAVNQLVYKPDATATGKDTFYYVIEDGVGRTNWATVKVNAISVEP